MINSRAKGASFENTLCKMIRDTFKMDKEQCYRTPLSGGHQAYSRTSPGDILLGDKLRPLFPFVIEAKHRRIWTPVSFQSPMTKECSGWIAHLFQDLKKSPHKDARPLLVCRGQNTKIYAALRLDDFVALGLKLPDNYSGFKHRGVRWLQIRFTDLLGGMAAVSKGGT